MNHEEYHEQLRVLENDYNEARKEFAVKYAKSINPYNIGDVITDGTTTLRIEKFRVYLDIKNPRLNYYGIELKKDGTPRKKQRGVYIYQSNIITQPK